jgi:crotonobetainyl-CoA:carnitine CoA-transferase CaiB-like acyl-CoA transferase
MLFQSGELTQFEGRSAARLGARDWPGPHAMERLYECSDGWIMVAAGDHTQRRALLGAAEVSTDVRTGSDDGELARAIAAAFARVDADDAIARLRAAGVPAVTVLGRGAVYADPWFAENRFFRSFEQPGLGPCLAVAGYASWRDHIVEYDRPAPRNGEHTREVLESIGLEPERLETLIRCGAAHVFDGA